MELLTLMTATNTVLHAWVWLLQLESMPVEHKLNFMVQRPMLHWSMSESELMQEPDRLKIIFLNKSFTNQQ